MRIKQRWKNWMRSISFVVLFLMLVLLALGIIARQLTPLLSRYPAEIKSITSQFFATEIDFATVQAHWKNLGPTLEFEQVELKRPELKQPLIRMRHLSLHFNLLKMLLGDWGVPSRVIADGLNIRLIQTAPNQWQLNGWQIPSKTSPAWLDKAVLEQLWTQWIEDRAWGIHHADILIVRLHHRPLWLRNVHFQLRTHSEKAHVLVDTQFAHTLKADANAKSSLQLRATFHRPPYLDPDSFGHGQLKITGVDFTEWLAQWGHVPTWYGLALRSGKGGAELEFDFRESTLQNIQGLAKFNDLEVEQTPVLSYWNDKTIGNFMSAATSNLRFHAPFLLRTNDCLAPQAPAKTPLICRFPSHYLPVQTLQSSFTWHRRANGWRLQAKLLQLNIYHNWAWLPMSMVLERKHMRSQHVVDTMQLDKLHLEDVLPVYIWLRPDFLIQYPLFKHASGTLQQLMFKRVTPENAERTAANWQLEAAVDDIGLVGIKAKDFIYATHSIGFSGARGYLYMSPTEGHFEINAPNFKVHGQGMFRQDIPLRMSGTLRWQQRVKGLEIIAGPLTLLNDEAKVRTRFSLWLPASITSPELNMETYFYFHDFGPAKSYLPASVLPKELVAWLDHAIVGGKQANARLLFRGPIHDFPFDHGEGMFSVAGSVQDLTLRYAPDWPAAEHVSGTLLFRNRMMQMTIDSGTVAGAPLQHVEAWMPRMTHHEIDWVYVQGAVAGTLEQGLVFIRQSPMQQKIGQGFVGATAQGPLDVQLALTIPLSKQSLPIEVTGLAGLRQSALTWPAWRVALEALEGNIHFTRDTISAETLRGRLLGAPIYLRIATTGASDKDRVTQFAAMGHFNLEAVAKQWQLHLQPHFQGNADYRVLLRATHNGGHVETIHLTSDLEGITSNLPSPFNKAAEEKQPLVMSLRPLPAQQLRVDIQTSPRGGASILIAREKQHTRLHGALIYLGDGVLPPAKQAGLWIVGQLSTTSLEKLQILWKSWQDYRQKQTHTSANTKEPLAFRGAQISVERFVLADTILPHLKITMNTEPQGMKLHLDSTRLAGNVFMPSDTKQAIRAEFKRVYLDSLDKTTNPNNNNLKPQDMRSMWVTVKDFRQGNKRLGEVEWEALLRGNTFLIKSFIAISNAFTLNATGRWVPEGEHTFTYMSGNFAARDFARALQQWGVPPVILSQRAQAKFALTWPGSPQSIAMTKLAGIVDLQLQSGSIAQLDPETEASLGLGRLLNILSLQTLPRRLTLDFSDLTQRGFPFDTLQGQWKFDAGNAWTENTVIDGPVARIQMQGRIGLKAHDYDLHLRVTPYVTASLPLVATIAGGPLAGVATWAVDKLLGSPVNQISSYTIIMKGPWQKPAVHEKVHR